MVLIGVLSEIPLLSYNLLFTDFLVEQVGLYLKFLDLLFLLKAFGE